MTPEDVAAASAAWVWVHEAATTTETDEYLLVRMPDYFPHPLELVRFDPDGRLDEAVDRVLAAARGIDVEDLTWWVKLSAPPALDDLLVARGAVLDETLDVLALDLTQGPPDLGGAHHVAVRWTTDPQTAHDSFAVGVEVFGGRLPPDDELQRVALSDTESVPAGRGGSLVAYLDGRPVGTAGLAVGGQVARLWGGAVIEDTRGRGVYRALLEARLDYALTHGLTLALVRGRVQTSGPILRRAGFGVFGQERSYALALRP